MPVGLVGVVGFLPPLSFGALVGINYAEMSPTKTQVFSALLMREAYDHWALSFKPGVALIVTPPVATTVV